MLLDIHPSLVTRGVLQYLQILPLLQLWKCWQTWLLPEAFLAVNELWLLRIHRDVLGLG